MKAITLINKINKELSTKTGTLQVKYSECIKVLQGKRVHPCSSSKYGKTDGYYYSITEGLTKLGIDYTVGNDSLRGGHAGNYIELSEKGKKQCADFIKEFKKQEEISKQKEAEKLAKIEELKQIEKTEIYNEVNLLKPFLPNVAYVLDYAKKFNGIQKNDIHAIFMKQIIKISGVEKINHFWQVFRVLNTLNNN